MLRGIENESIQRDSLQDAADVVVVQDREGAVPIKKPHVSLYKPFSALSLAAVLNNEAIMNALGEADREFSSFSAPGASILIVDDNEVNLKVAVGLLQPYHMKCATVTSGEAAISFLSEQTADLVLMDHMMPKMDGVETTKIIRDMPGEYYKNLPIIALTANAVNGVRDFFIQNGFNDFVAKPIVISTLDKVLKKWLPKELIEPPIKQGKSKMEREDMHKLDDGGLISEEAGLSFTGGNKEVYYDILSTYILRGGRKVDEIRRLYEMQDWTNYIIEVHALKSASLNIGCKVLSEQAKRMEFAGKEGDYKKIHQENEDMLQLYEKVLSEAKEKLEKSGLWKTQASQGARISNEEKRELLFGVKKACENYDTDEALRMLQQLMSAQWDEEEILHDLSWVKEEIDLFEYDKALAKIELLLRHFGE